jgi:hypothetical protein
MNYDEVESIIELFKSKAPSKEYLYNHGIIENDGMRYTGITLFDSTSKDAIKVASLDIRGVPDCNKFSIGLHWNWNELRFINNPEVLRDMIDKHITVPKLQITH